MPNARKILGPFLMRPTSFSMGFWLAAGPGQNVQFKIKVFLNQELVEELIPQQLEGTCLGVSTTQTTKKLKAQTKYHYHCFADDVPLFEGSFSTLPIDKDVPFYFLSCNGISYHEWHGPDKDAWKVWKMMQEEVELEIAPPLLFMCGDQVYMDMMFQEDIKKIQSFSDSEIWHKIYQVYFDHWKDFSYLKVLGQVPALMMGDDHDFIDGFGSREEQFTEKDETANWKYYRRFVIQAFWEMQAVRNGDKNDQSFLTQKKLGKSHFILPDLRSERNFLKKQMLSLSQKKALEDYAANEVKSGDTLYFISSVTLGRMSELAEIFLSNFSNYLWRLNSWIGRDSTFAKVLWSMVMAIFFAANVDFYYSFFFWSLWWMLSESSKGKTDFHPLIHALLSKTAILSVLLCAFKIYSLGVLPHFQMPPPLFIALLGIGGVFSYLGNFYKNFYHPQKIKIYGAIAALFLMAGLIIKFNFFILFFVIFTLLEGLGIIDLFASSDDDMKDAWSAEVNTNELIWLSIYFKKLLEKEVNITFLTGDIHTGGVASFNLKELPHKKIYHLVSSPVAYFPMSKRTEKLTSAKKTISLPWKKPILDFTNQKYFSQRHFAQVTPGEIPQVEFTLEDGSRQRFNLLR